MIETSEEFIKLRSSEDPAEYMKSRIDSAPLSVWVDLIENHPEMKVWVARNRTIPNKIIDILSKDEDSIVRYAISSKYPLDIKYYILFSKDRDESIRAGLTYNKGLPIYILKEMAENDISDFVRSQAIEQYEQRMSKTS